MNSPEHRLGWLESPFLCLFRHLQRRAAAGYFLICRCINVLDCVRVAPARSLPLLLLLVACLQLSLPVPAAEKSVGQQAFSYLVAAGANGMMLAN